MGNKFHAKKTIVDGIIFDSKIESEYYKYLKELQEQDVVSHFEMQTTFILQEKFIKLDGKIITGDNPDFNRIKRKYKLPTISAITYKADFDVIYSNGTREVIDIKGGILTETFKLKRKLFEFKYPELIFKAITKDKKTNEWISFEDYKKLEKERKKNKVKSK